MRVAVAAVDKGAAPFSSSPYGAGDGESKRRYSGSAISIPDLMVRRGRKLL
jgi:hypothetical protein